MAEAWQLNYPNAENVYSGGANIFLASMKSAADRMAQVSQHRAVLAQQQARDNEARQQHIDEHNRQVAEDEAKRHAEQVAEDRQKKADTEAATQKARELLIRGDVEGARNVARIWDIKDLRQKSRVEDLKPRVDSLTSHLDAVGEAPERPEGVTPDMEQEPAPPVPGGPVEPPNSTFPGPDSPPPPPGPTPQTLAAAVAFRREKLDHEQRFAAAQAKDADERERAEAADKYDRAEAEAKDKTDPMYVADGPDGPVNFDPRAHERESDRLHDVAAAEVRALAAKTDYLQTPPFKNVKKHVEFIANQLDHRMIDPADARKELSDLLGFDVKYQDAALTAAIMKARVGNDREFKEAGLGEREEGNRIRQRDAFNATMKRYEDLVHVGKDRDLVIGLRQSYDELSKPQQNAMMQAATMFAFAKAANGAGVLTDQDYRKAVGAKAGLSGRVKDFLEEWKTGRLGDGTLETLVEANKRKYEFARQKLQLSHDGMIEEGSQPDFGQFKNTLKAKMYGLFHGVLPGYDAKPVYDPEGPAALLPPTQRPGHVKRTPAGAPPKPGKPAAAPTRIDEAYKRATEILERLAAKHPPGQ